MSCFHPLKGFNIGVWEESGKPKYKICSYDTEYIQEINGVWTPIKVKPEKVQTKHGEQYVYSPFHRYRTEFIPIPCGKCYGCRMDYSKQWANRCMLELKYHQESWFLTLTYDNEHLPHPAYDEYGEVVTLKHEDVQLFLKRLRFHVKEKLRFFMAGEYGGMSGRPHYHMIVFGLHIDPKDLKVYKHVRGYNYYTCSWIEKIWGKGFVVIGEVNWETCAYTARYMMKKHKGSDPDGKKWQMYYDSIGIDREYVCMSRKPGIAAQYYEDHKDKIYEYDKILISKGDEVIEVKPPKYFDKKFDIEEHEIMAALKEKRKELAENGLRKGMNSTRKEVLEYLADQEKFLMQKTKSLRRSLENGET